MFLNIQIDMIILKADDKQFTSTTKKSLHITFKRQSGEEGIFTQIISRPKLRMGMDMPYFSK